MRNPKQLYDSDIPKQEPLRSLFRRRTESGIKNDREYHECAQELMKKHIDAVKAWLELAFPAKNAPMGKTMIADSTSLILFIRFHWLLHTSGYPDARKLLDVERIKRQWPTRTIPPKQVSEAASGGRNGLGESQARPGSKPTKPAASHAMATSKSLRDNRSRSDTSTVNVEGPRVGSAIVNPVRPLPTRSANMETSSSSVPQKRPSTPSNQRTSKRRVIKDRGTATKAFSHGGSMVGSRKEASDDTSTNLEQVYSALDAAQNTAMCKADRPAKFESNSKGTSAHRTNGRKHPHINKATSESSKTTATVLSSSAVPTVMSTAQALLSQHSTDSFKSYENQNSIGDNVRNSRPIKGFETHSAPLAAPVTFKRKRVQSLEINAKLVRTKSNSSSHLNPKGYVSTKAESAAEMSSKSLSTTGVKEHDVPVKFESGKDIRKIVDGITEKPVTSTVTSTKSSKGNKKKKKTKFLSTKKITGSRDTMTVNQWEDAEPPLNEPVIIVQPANVQRNMINPNARKSYNLQSRRWSLRLNPQDSKSKLVPSPLTTQIHLGNPSGHEPEHKERPTGNNTRQLSAAIPYSPIPKADIATSPSQQIASPMECEWTKTRDPAIISESVTTVAKPITANHMAPQYPPFPSVHNFIHVNPKTGLPEPFVSSPINHTPVCLMEDGGEENSSLALDDEDVTADVLTSSEPEANHVVEDSGQVFDNLCRFPKAPLQFLPPLWSESRQEICETFDWFRSYQGGVYHSHNVAKGYLLGAFPARRDRFEHGGRLIISHGGGKAESIHSKQGQLSSQPATDQMAQDKSVRALWNNYQNNRPLVLLMDDRYALFPYDLRAKKVAYAVLGFYTISHAWAEYQPSNNENGRVVRYKFAFRWCDQQGTPWWQKEANEDLSPPVRDIESHNASRFTTVVTSEDYTGLTHDFRIKLKDISPVGDGKDVLFEQDKAFVGTRKYMKQACSSCSEDFPQIYELCWTCLNPDCCKFFTQRNGETLPDNLDYSSSFLELTPSVPMPVGFGTLMPPPVMSLNIEDKTTYAFTRGFHCELCGRFSCRYQWERWECRNCQLSIIGSDVTQRQVSSISVIREATTLMYQTPSSNFKDYVLNRNSEITQLPSRSFRHDKGRGTVQTFVLPYDRAKIHHIQPGNVLGREEADSIFLDYQTQANSGELKFRRWPMRAHKCRGSLLTNYFSQNSGAPYKYVGGDAHTVPFEAAPGAVVRARNLIQKRIMQALNVPAQFNEVLSAAYMERQKMAFHSDNERGLGPLVAGLSLGSPALMHFRLHAKHDPEREKRGIFLSIVLRHGDILVMDGAAVQDYYEHTVVPTNFRIAATARQINADHA